MTYLDLLKDQPGEILFISERQLLSFDEIQGVRVVPDWQHDQMLADALMRLGRYPEAYNILEEAAERFAAWFRRATHPETIRRRRAEIQKLGGGGGSLLPAPLAAPREQFFYTPDAEGYCDYPPLAG